MRTASSSANAPVAAGSPSALANWTATSDAYRGPEPNASTAKGISATSKLGLIATGTVPASKLRTITCKPATWWAGSANNQVPTPPIRSWVADALAISAGAVSMAPLGIPVVPEVDTTTATSSSISSPIPSDDVSNSADRTSEGTGRIADSRPSSTPSSSARSGSGEGIGGMTTARRGAMRTPRRLP